MWGEQGAAAVSFTPHDLAPPEKGMGAGGAEREWGEDEEVGRVAYAVRRIAELG